MSARLIIVGLLVLAFSGTANAGLTAKQWAFTGLKGGCKPPGCRPMTKKEMQETRGCIRSDCKPVSRSDLNYLLKHGRWPDGLPTKRPVFPPGMLDSVTRPALMPMR